MDLAELGFKFKANAHAEKLLGQQLGSIWHVDPDNVIERLTEAAVRTPYFPATSHWTQNHICNIVALSANVHLRAITESKEAFVQVG